MKNIIFFGSQVENKSSWDVQQKNFQRKYINIININNNQKITIDKSWRSVVDVVIASWFVHMELHLMIG